MMDASNNFSKRYKQHVLIESVRWLSRQPHIDGLLCLSTCRYYMMATMRVVLCGSSTLGFCYSSVFWNCHVVNHYNVINHCFWNSMHKSFWPSGWAKPKRVKLHRWSHWGPGLWAGGSTRCLENSNSQVRYKARYKALHFYFTSTRRWLKLHWSLNIEKFRLHGRNQIFQTHVEAHSPGALHFELAATEV